MLSTIGLGSGDISNHVAYGSILIHAAEEQETLMFVGSDDAVRVWMNGEVVHEHFVDRAAYDYQDVFKVSLKQGTNVLLVAVYEAYGHWSGFFGFEPKIEYEILPPRGLTVDVNEDGKINVIDLYRVLLAINAQNHAKPIQPRTDVNKDGVVNMADLHQVIEYIDDPVTGAAPVLQNAVSRPSARGKLVTTWANLKMTK
ncbi:MAG: dockerin type I domain-containing protein [Candidatus Poribacteria bacterium]|nr:dockerin type I domain-containing protein [Candidatus Poribacteria bacterium]